MYYIGQTGKSIQKGLEYDFVIYDIIEMYGERHLVLRLTSGDKKGKLSAIREREIDNTLVFNNSTPGTANTAKQKTLKSGESNQTATSSTNAKSARSTSPSNKKKK